MGSAAGDVPEVAAPEPQPEQDPERRAGLLFRNRDYTGWWIGQTISEFGSGFRFIRGRAYLRFVTAAILAAMAASTHIANGLYVLRQPITEATAD
jgi:hypothetical protein